MENKREALKALLPTINPELKKHGGSDNTLKITKLNPAQIEFLYELLTAHLETYRNFVVEQLIAFAKANSPQLTNLKMLAHVHQISLPTSFEGDFEWEIILGKVSFGSTQVILSMKKWEIANHTLVG